MMIIKSEFEGMNEKERKEDKKEGKVMMMDIKIEGRKDKKVRM